MPTGRNANDARLRPDRYAIVSTPRDAWGGASPIALVDLPRAGADQANDPTSAPPRPGDRLIFLAGPKQGKPARSEDLELGGPQAQAYPADLNGAVRNGTPLNLVILVRVGGDGLDEETRARSADGVVAYLGVSPGLSGQHVVER